VLVLEFFEQGTLADMIRVAPLPPAEVVRLGLALGEALHSLHRVGVLHRDIKPSNIGFTARHVPKLLDFGLAHAPPRRLHDPHSDADADQATTRTAFPADEPFEASDEPMAGTVMYMSPEAIAGEPPDVGFDLWGLGVTLYEALTGVHPFQGIDRADTIRRVQRAAPRPVAELCPDCPEPLARVLHRAIAARRAERPASARELVLAIRETAAQVPALAGPDRERIF
jgi:serine/threonine-protein kinase